MSFHCLLLQAASGSIQLTNSLPKPLGTAGLMLKDCDPIAQALLGSLFTWAVTALGSAFVFLVKPTSQRILDASLGFSAGVMTAASFWSLLDPAISIANQLYDRMVTATSWRRIFLLVVAITVHNIPEGLAVGVGFGAVGTSTGYTFEKARNLAIAFGYSKWSSFMYGQLSGMVEPLAALAGAVGVTAMHALLPFSLSFAAGAMIYVVFDDVIPEAQSRGNSRLVICVL
uniref:Zinc transporter ZIP11 n=1 Tax=Trichuris muris TaxID=70415 RepID=A0A5S6QFS5_TRIMR